MASLIFDSFLDDLSQGNVKTADTFYGALVTSAYAPNKATHTKRSDVTNEVAGAGYVAGGAAIGLVATKDTANHREDWTFAPVAWANATLTGRGLVIYKHRGGAAAADELVCYIDFGGDVVSTAGTFTVTPSTPLRFQN